MCCLIKLNLKGKKIKHPDNETDITRIIKILVLQQYCARIAILMNFHQKQSPLNWKNWLNWLLSIALVWILSDYVSHTRSINSIGEKKCNNNYSCYALLTKIAPSAAQRQRLASTILGSKLFLSYRQAEYWFRWLIPLIPAVCVCVCGRQHRLIDCALFSPLAISLLSKVEWINE